MNTTTIIIYGIFAIYLLIINMVSFYMFGIDKRKAKAGRAPRTGRTVKKRIPEKVLLIVSAIGGAAGAFIGMRAYHHKTTKKKFSLGIPAMLIMQCLIVMLMLARL